MTTVIHIGLSFRIWEFYFKLEPQRQVSISFLKLQDQLKTCCDRIMALLVKDSLNFFYFSYFFFNTILSNRYIQMCAHGRFSFDILYDKWESWFSLAYDMGRWTFRRQFHKHIVGKLKEKLRKKEKLRSSNNWWFLRLIKPRSNAWKNQSGGRSRNSAQINAPGFLHKDLQ